MFFSPANRIVQRKTKVNPTTTQNYSHCNGIALLPHLDAEYGSRGVGHVQPLHEELQHDLVGHLLIRVVEVKQFILISNQIRADHFCDLLERSRS